MISDTSRQEAGRFVRRAHRWLGAILLVSVFGGLFLVIDTFARGQLLAAALVVAFVLLIVAVVFAAEAAVWLVELRRRD